MKVHGTPGAHARHLRNVALRNVALGVGLLPVGVVALVALGGFSVFKEPGLRSAVALLVLACMFAASVWARTQVTRSEKAMVGMRSEVRVGKELSRCGASALVNGAMLGAGGDADHVVLGPVAVVVETKTGRGRVRMDGSSLVVGQRTLVGEPLEQARRQAKKLSGKLGVSVDAVVCVPDMEGPPKRLNGVTVCSLDDLVRTVQSMPQHLDQSSALRHAEAIAP